MNRSHAATLLVGQSPIFTLAEDRGTGDAHCLPIASRRTPHLMVASRRYLDPDDGLPGRFDNHRNVAR